MNWEKEIKEELRFSIWVQEPGRGGRVPWILIVKNQTLKFSKYEKGSCTSVRVKIMRIGGCEESWKAEIRKGLMRDYLKLEPIVNRRQILEPKPTIDLGYNIYFASECLFLLVILLGGGYFGWKWYKGS